MSIELMTPALELAALKGWTLRTEHESGAALFDCLDGTQVELVPEALADLLKTARAEQAAGPDPSAAFIQAAEASGDPVFLAAVKAEQGRFQALLEVIRLKDTLARLRLDAEFARTCNLPIDPARVIRAVTDALQDREQPRAVAASGVK